jgi:hypothetical protein
MYVAGSSAVMATVRASSGGINSNIDFMVTTHNTASFIKADKTTKGSWKNGYGADGYFVAGVKKHLPGYVQFSLTGKKNKKWASSTTDARALQKPTTGRIAAAWDAVGNFAINLNFTDDKTHRVAIYALDWDTKIRKQKVEVVDGNTGAVLDTRQLRKFQQGRYLVWNLSGNVIIRVTNQAGKASNAVVSGVFFG